MNESPTPYDILPPAPFPFAFPWYAPCLLLVVLAVALAFWWYARRTAPPSFQSVHQQLRTLLDSLLSSNEISPESLNRLRLQLQRYLALSTGESDTLSYSESDLKTLLSSAEDSPLCEICKTLILIEHSRYSSQRNIVEITESLKKLGACI